MRVIKFCFVTCGDGGPLTTDRGRATRVENGRRSQSSSEKKMGLSGRGRLARSGTRTPRRDRVSGMLKKKKERSGIIANVSRPRARKRVDLLSRIMHKPHTHTHTHSKCKQSNGVARGVVSTAHTRRVCVHRFSTG